jgi:hypothetical protein
MNRFHQDLIDFGCIFLEESTRYYRYKEIFLYVPWVYRESGKKFYKNEDHFTGKITVSWDRLKEVIQIFDVETGDNSPQFDTIEEFQTFINSQS